jgi:hypothetical protein
VQRKKKLLLPTLLLLLTTLLLKLLPLLATLLLPTLLLQLLTLLKLLPTLLLPLPTLLLPLPTLLLLQLLTLPLQLLLLLLLTLLPLLLHNNTIQLRLDLKKEASASFFVFYSNTSQKKASDWRPFFLDNQINLARFPHVGGIFVRRGMSPHDVQ